MKGAGFFAAMAAAPGTWQGHGINHEGQPFCAELVARALLGGRGILLWFRARNDSGFVFHEEVGIIGRDKNDYPMMMSLNTNIDFTQLFVSGPEFVSNKKISLNYSCLGGRDDFVETIGFGLVDENIQISFEWTLPGMVVPVRSEAVLARCGISFDDDCPIRPTC